VVRLGDGRIDPSRDSDSSCPISNFLANQVIPDLPVSDCLIFVANGFVSLSWRIPDSPSGLASHAPPTS
jgi:hypothetical protein